MNAQTLDREEARRLLEEIARNDGNQAARVAAIRQLLTMMAEDNEDGQQTPERGYDELDERRYRTKQAA